MRYTLSFPFHVRLARERLEHLIRRGATIELTEKRPRSLQQNAYLHVCLSWFGLQVGESTDEVKRRYYKLHCSPDIFVREKDDPVLHVPVKYLRSSADLSSEEMAITIERFRNFASQEAGIYIPSADEHAFIMQMQVEISRNQIYTIP